MCNLALKRMRKKGECEECESRSTYGLVESVNPA